MTHSTRGGDRRPAPDCSPVRRRRSACTSAASSRAGAGCRPAPASPSRSAESSVIIASSGNRIVPIGSTCTAGFSDTRPSSRAVGSPSLSADHACAASCTERETTRRVNWMRIPRKSMPCKECQRTTASWTIASAKFPDRRSTMNQGLIRGRRSGSDHCSTPDADGHGAHGASHSTRRDHAARDGAAYRSIGSVLIQRRSSTSRTPQDPRDAGCVVSPARHVSPVPPPSGAAIDRHGVGSVRVRAETWSPWTRPRSSQPETTGSARRSTTGWPRWHRRWRSRRDRRWPRGRSA